MGLFRKVAGLAASRAASSIKKAVEKPDERPPMPGELDKHLRTECVRVWLNEAGLAFTEGRQMENVQVRVRKARKAEEGAEYNVSLTDGTVIGTMGQDGFLRSGVKTRGELTAEVSGPIWEGMRYGTVYIPITAERMKLREMNVWINVSTEHWTGPDGARVDATGGEILERRNGKGKPSYVVIGGDIRLFDVTSRMSCYSVVAERANLPLRRVIAEWKDGEHGGYWRVGLYY